MPRPTVSDRTRRTTWFVSAHGLRQRLAAEAALDLNKSSAREHLFERSWRQVLGLLGELLKNSQEVDSAISMKFAFTLDVGLHRFPYGDEPRSRGGHYPLVENVQKTQRRETLEEKGDLVDRATGIVRKP